MTVLHGITTIQLKHHPDSPSCIELKPTIPLERFAWHGASRKAIRTMERTIPITSSGTVYLIQETKQDVSWAMNYLQDNLVIVRELIKSELSSGALQSYRPSIPNGDVRLLDDTQLMSLLKKVAQHEQSSAKLALHSSLHAMLVGKAKLPFANRATVLEQLQNLQNQEVLDLQADTYYPAGGDDRWVLSWRQNNLLVDRKNLLVLEVNENSAEAHQLPSQESLQQWLQDKMNLIALGDTDQTGRWPAPIFNITASQDTIAAPPIGGLGDLHQWEALIGGADAVAADEIDTASNDALAQQPPAAWMPGMSAAMVATSNQEIVAPPELAHSVQLHNLGSIVHTGCPVQTARLTCETKTVRLFHPVNPFRGGPLGMSRS